MKQDTAPLEIKIVDAHHPDLHSLIAKLDLDLLERYPPEDISTVDFQDPKVALMVFAVAYWEVTPVACGGLKPLGEETWELKRFFVDGLYRNRGIASALLTFLENQAKKLGARRILLETGWEQPEAVALYRKFGYVQIERYGEYADCEASVCFEKPLLLPPV